MNLSIKLSGLLFSSTTVANLWHLPEKRLIPHDRTNYKLKAHIFLADLKVSLLKDKRTHPAPDNWKNRLTKTSDQFIQILDLPPKNLIKSGQLHLLLILPWTDVKWLSTQNWTLAIAWFLTPNWERLTKSEPLNNFLYQNKTNQYFG